MALHRFFVSPESIQHEWIQIREPDLVLQLTKVLRLRAKDQAVFLDNSGREFVAELRDLTKKNVSAQILEIRENAAEPALKVRLCQALPRLPAKLEQILQHGTELGICEFQPLLTERTQTQQLKNPARLRKIIQEAAEQSERGRLPSLAEPAKLEELLDRPGVKLIGDSYGAAPSLAELKPGLAAESEISIFIGPEGGFSAREIELAKEKGAQPFSLGPRILRLETAALAAAAILLAN